MGSTPRLIGHLDLWARLTAMADGDRLGHALLFSGPEGVGKTTLALLLAERLLGASTWPGGLRAHPDLWLEDGDAERIGLARITPRSGEVQQSLQQMLSLRPYAGGMRVALLARAERLTEPAADALLKTLEEPPPRSLVILATSSPDALPATLLSRVRQQVVGPVALPAIIQWLIGAGVDVHLAELAGGLSAGRPGRALRLAAEPGALRAEVAGLNAFLGTGGGGTEAALRTAAALAPGPGSDGRERALVLLAVWASFTRDALHSAVSAPGPRVWPAYAGAVEQWAESLGPARLTAILGLLLRSSAEIAVNAQPRLVLETLLLEVFGGAGSPPPVEVPAALPGLLGAPEPPARSPTRAAASTGGRRRPSSRGRR